MKNPNERSWRSKLLRAEHHFGYFKLHCGALAPDVYSVNKRFETYDGMEQWVWWPEIPTVDEPDLAILAGDILFNVRSALDHLGIALIPPTKRTQRIIRSAQFPIFTCDIDERDLLTGAHAHPNQRSAWDRQTQGLTEEALTAVKWHQPYNFSAKGLDPRDSSFAVLSALQNADKHRQLVVARRGIRDPIGIWTKADGTVHTIPLPPVPGGFIAEGTALDWDTTDVYAGMDMELKGTPEIFIGESWDGPYREATSCLRAIIDSGWACVERLEPLVIE